MKKKLQSILSGGDHPIEAESKGLVISWPFIMKTGLKVVLLALTSFCAVSWASFLSPAIRPIVKAEMTNQIADSLEPMVRPIVVKTFSDEILPTIKDHDIEMERSYITKSEFRELQQKQDRMMELLQGMRVDVAVLAEKIKNDKNYSYTPKP